MKCHIKLRTGKTLWHKHLSAWDETQTYSPFSPTEQQLLLIISCSALLSLSPWHSEHVAHIHPLPSQTILLQFYLPLPLRTQSSSACNQNSTGRYQGVARPDGTACVLALFIIHARPPHRSFPSSFPQSPHPPFCSHSVQWIYEKVLRGRPGVTVPTSWWIQCRKERERGESGRRERRR